MKFAVDQWNHGYNRISNEGKSVTAERFIRFLKKNIYKYMTATPKNVFIHKLDVIVDKYNDTYKTIKMNAIDAEKSTCIDFVLENNGKDPKFKVGDHLKISKHFC